MGSPDRRRSRPPSCLGAKPEPAVPESRPAVHGRETGTTPAHNAPKQRFGPEGVAAAGNLAAWSSPGRRRSRAGADRERAGAHATRASTRRGHRRPRASRHLDDIGFDAQLDRPGPPLRRPVGQPALRLGGALASFPGQGVLHDRFGRPREQCHRRDGHSNHRPGTAPLPQRRLLPGPRRSRRNRRHPRRGGRSHERADLRRPPQGVRSPRPRHHPADLDDRLTPAESPRCGLRDRPRRQAQGAVRLAGRCHHGVQLRRRFHQSFGRRRGVQHRDVLRASAPPAPAAVRLRGQRVGDQRAHPHRLDRDRIRVAAAPAVRGGRR